MHQAAAPVTGRPGTGAAGRPRRNSDRAAEPRPAAQTSPRPRTRSVHLRAFASFAFPSCRAGPATAQPRRLKPAARTARLPRTTASTVLRQAPASNRRAARRKPQTNAHTHGCTRLPRRQRAARVQVRQDAPGGTATVRPNHVPRRQAALGPRNRAVHPRASASSAVPYPSPGAARQTGQGRHASASVRPRHTPTRKTRRPARKHRSAARTQPRLKTGRPVTHHGI